VTVKSGFLGEIENQPAPMHVNPGGRDLCAEIGDVRRFDIARQLMSLLGSVPAERSTGETVRRAGMTLAGNRRARLEGLPKTVRDIAWKAQVRLCGRYRRLSAAGKKLPVIIAAIAREMAAFLWAIGRQVTPAAVT
jgi:transposase